MGGEASGICCRQPISLSPCDSAKLGTPEINVGLFPMMIMAVLSPRGAEADASLEMMLFGEKLERRAMRSARSASSASVVPAAELDAAVKHHHRARSLSKSAEHHQASASSAFAAIRPISTLEAALPMLLRERLFG